MDTTDDPVIGRYDDALSRLRDLENAALRGEEIPNSQIVGEVRAIRDDLIADRRDDLRWRSKIERLIDGKLNRQPAVGIGRYVVTSLGILVLGALGFLIQRGLSNG